MLRLHQELAGLLREAGLGAEAEATMLEEALAGFLHPALIGPGPKPEREDALRRLLKVVLAGLAASKEGGGA